MSVPVLTTKEALEQVLYELENVSYEEFKAIIKEHENSEIVVALKETSEFLIEFKERAK